MKAKQRFYAMGQRDEALHKPRQICFKQYQMQNWPCWAHRSYIQGRADFWYSSTGIQQCKPS
jgi:hypothetical protein